MTDWVICPKCDEPDMMCENGIVHCVNEQCNRIGPVTLAPIDEQRKIEDDLERFHKERGVATVKSKFARKALDEFIKINGNKIVQQQNKDHWDAMQPELAARRKTMEWQAWHKEFMINIKSQPEVSDMSADDLRKSMNILMESDISINNPNAFIFMHKDMSEEDKELFLGPISGGEEVILFDDTWAMAHVLVHAGVFPSLGQARKNGGDGPIANGFSEFSRGKNQRRKDITILNKF
jgi:hypothetical protein